MIGHALQELARALRLWNFRKYGTDRTVQSTLFDFMEGGPGDE
jgi:hypothetical protein